MEKGGGGAEFFPLLIKVGVRGPLFSTSHAHTRLHFPCVVFPQPTMGSRMAATSTVPWLEAWWSLISWQGDRQVSEGGQCCLQPQGVPRG